MRDYLHCRVEQLRRPQTGSTQSTNYKRLSEYEEVAVVMGYNHTSPPISYAVRNGDTSTTQETLLNFNESFPTSVEGTACTAFASGLSLRVCYLNCQGGTKILSTTARAALAGRLGAFVIGFGQDTYDETSDEDNAWSVPFGTAQSEVGEVCRID